VGKKIITFNTGESPTTSLETVLIVAGTPENNLGVARKILFESISNPVVTTFSPSKRVLSVEGQSAGKSNVTKFHCFTTSIGDSPRQFALMISDINVVILMSSLRIIFLCLIVGDYLE
jgi:hypothetical protein